jgi:hypothetical protein
VLLNRDPCVVLDQWLYNCGIVTGVVHEQWLCFSETRSVLGKRAVAV